MEQNYTPLNLQDLKPQTISKVQKDSKITTILMIIATITAAVLAALLLILIQKKIQRQNLQQTNTESVSVIENQQPSIFLSPTPLATTSPTITISPSP